LKPEAYECLGRRHIESYLYDDEVLAALCVAYNQPTEAANLRKFKQDAFQENATKQNKPIDDVKSAAGTIYVRAKERLSLRGVGNDHKAFERNVLAPLLVPTMKAYQELRASIFKV
jgi:hypothetical protein